MLTNKYNTYNTESFFLIIYLTIIESMIILIFLINLEIFAI